MAHLCGRRVESIEILGDEELSGSVSTLSLNTDSSSSLEMELQILCLLAGQAAESIGFPGVVLFRENEDLDAAIRIALKLVSNPEKVMPFLEHAEAGVVSFLKREWDSVEALVEKLLRNPVLEGEELRTILAGVSCFEDERAVS